MIWHIDTIVLRTGAILQPPVLAQFPWFWNRLLRVEVWSNLFSLVECDPRCYPYITITLGGVEMCNLHQMLHIQCTEIEKEFMLLESYPDLFRRLVIDVLLNIGHLFCHFKSKDLDRAFLLAGISTLFNWNIVQSTAWCSGGSWGVQGIKLDPPPPPRF